jgi:hypothetical protein
MQQEVEDLSARISDIQKMLESAFEGTTEGGEKWVVDENSIKLADCLILSQSDLESMLNALDLPAVNEKADEMGDFLQRARRRAETGPIYIRLRAGRDKSKARVRMSDITINRARTAATEASQWKDKVILMEVMYRSGKDSLESLTIKDSRNRKPQGRQTKSRKDG